METTRFRWDFEWISYLKRSSKGLKSGFRWQVQVPSAPAGRKVSGPSPLLAPEDTLAYRLRARSRRGGRPPRDALRHSAEAQSYALL